MKYKIEYQLEGDPKIHRRYYSALNKGTAREMFKASQEESLGGWVIVEESVKIFGKDKNGRWEE